MGCCTWIVGMCKMHYGMFRENIKGREIVTNVGQRGEEGESPNVLQQS